VIPTPVNRFRPGVPAPAHVVQPAPQAAAPIMPPQYQPQAEGVNKGELGKPWANTFSQAPAATVPGMPVPGTPIKKPVETNQGVAGSIGDAAGFAGFGL